MWPVMELIRGTDSFVWLKFGRPFTHLCCPAARYFTVNFGKEAGLLEQTGRNYTTPHTPRFPGRQPESRVL